MFRPRLTGLRAHRKGAVKWLGLPYFSKHCNPNAVVVYIKCTYTCFNPFFPLEPLTTR
jgi:hypothetical protein